MECVASGGTGTAIPELEVNIGFRRSVSSFKRYFLLSGQLSSQLSMILRIAAPMHRRCLLPVTGISLNQVRFARFRPRIEASKRRRSLSSEHIISLTQAPFAGICLRIVVPMQRRSLLSMSGISLDQVRFARFRPRMDASKRRRNMLSVKHHLSELCCFLSYLLEDSCREALEIINFVIHDLTG